MKRVKPYLITLLVLLGILMGYKVSAFSEPLSIKIDQATIAKGYTAEFNHQDFRLAITQNLIDEEITLEMKQFDLNEWQMPNNLTLVSDGYIFDIKSVKGTNPLKFSRPLILAVRFNSDNYYLKSIYTWDSLKNAWIRMPSTTDYVGRYARAYTHLPFSRIAVFEDKNGLEGTASWYRSSKYPYGATCNNYPENTKLRVTNVDNSQSVVVSVVQGNMTHPERVIDLSLTAFKQIATAFEGLARVQVIPLEGLTDGIKVLALETKQTQTNNLNISSKAAMAINEKTGEVLYAKNENGLLPMASLTKIMTAVIFLETNTPWDKVVTYQAGDNAIGSRLYISPGETLTVKDLFFTALAGSANNATNALARSTGLSREEFIKRMNDKAREWGLSQTKFVDVTGLDPANVTTISEYAILASRALKDFRILQGTTTGTYSFTTINTGKAHTIINKNKLIGSSWYITGIKTGYLDEAGYCLMAKARKDKYSSPDVITVVLGAGSDTVRYQETEALIKYALSKL